MTQNSTERVNGRISADGPDHGGISGYCSIFKYPPNRRRLPEPITFAIMESLFPIRLIRFHVWSFRALSLQPGAPSPFRCHARRCTDRSPLQSGATDDDSRCACRCGRNTPVRLVPPGSDALLRPLHDRMPVILSPADEARWLDPGLTRPEPLQALLTPCDPEPMMAYPVSRRVNTPTQDDAALIAPLTLGESGSP